MAIGSIRKNDIFCSAVVEFVSFFAVLMTQIPSERTDEQALSVTVHRRDKRRKFINIAICNQAKHQIYPPC